MQQQLNTVQEQLATQQQQPAAPRTRAAQRAGSCRRACSASGPQAHTSRRPANTAQQDHEEPTEQPQHSIEEEAQHRSSARAALRQQPPSPSQPHGHHAGLELLQEQSQPADAQNGGLMCVNPFVRRSCCSQIVIWQHVVRVVFIHLHS